MNALTFNDVNFNPVEQNGQIWLTSSELAKALGYADHTGVNRAFNRNKDEFTPSMTQLVEINEEVKSTYSSKTKGLAAKTRIFSLRGCHLIAMFSRTKIGKKFRKWVLDILDKEVGMPVQKEVGMPMQKDLLTPEQTLPLRNAVNTLVTRAGIMYPEAYKIIHQKFTVNHIKELTVEQVPEAVTYIHWLTMTANTRNHANQVNAENAHALAVHMNNCADWFDAVREPLSQLNPQLTSSISGQFYEGRSTARLVRRELVSG
jgi:prophage antirepressor-like protein